MEQKLWDFFVRVDRISAKLRWGDHATRRSVRKRFWLQPSVSVEEGAFKLSLFLFVSPYRLPVPRQLSEVRVHAT